ncbi:MAG: WbqC family protein [Nitrospinota bacterium]
MIITVHQPQYLPWAGYFDKIDQSDVFVILDNVQFKKNEWQNRNRIKTSQAWQWITVPILHSFPEEIRRIRIDNKTEWGRKHLNTLITNYSKTKFFKDYITFFEDIYNREWDYLVDLNMEIIYYLINVLGLKKEIILSSSLQLSKEPTGRLIDICKSIGEDTYLSGQGGQDYMNMDRFREEGIKVIFQNFKLPSYNQLFGDFVPYLSIIDLLFNHGEESIDIIRKCRKGNNR